MDKLLGHSRCELAVDQVAGRGAFVVGIDLVERSLHDRDVDSLGGEFVPQRDAPSPRVGVA
ncbi:Uncharacterised protein [Mycobacteroides abscessus subsp. abscessus]|nr:Uncharacterised protein [Mycobacteroides abscessus subsp. abscessus]